MSTPPHAAPIPDGNKAGIAVTDQYVLVSVRRECMDMALATQIALGMVQAAEMADNPDDEAYRAAGYEPTLEEA